MSAALSAPAGPDTERTRAAVEALRRRSATVRFWRLALPGLIGAVLVTMVGWVVATSVEQQQPIGRDAGDIRMIGPEFHGRNKSGRAYVVTAASAIRDNRHVERINMAEPRVTLETPYPAPMKGQATNGLYDEQAQTMNLWGQVRMDDGRGNRFTSPTARVDVANHKAEGHDGVVADGPAGHMTAASYAIDDKDGRLLLSGRVHARINTKAARASPR